MRLMTSVVRLALCGAVLLIVACSDNGSGSGVDAGPDGSTDTDSDTDADTDAGPDGGTACVVYVNGADGDDGNAGDSWTSALATVQAGLNMAEGAGCDVWVAAGTYLPTEDASGDPAPSDERTKTILLKAGVAMYGGFAGDETALEERDVVANETILSGDLGIADDNSDNSYHVVIGADDASIDGFTITAGRAHDFQYESGGGMYNDGSSPTVTNCTFFGNTADWGGGMHNDDSSPNVTNCTFSGNSAEGGGGMYDTNASPTVTNCTFSDNSADYGGGMYNIESSPTVTNCTFSNNSTTYILSQAGGGMFNGGGSPTVTDCTFSGNSASSGGGMYNENSSPTVTNCTFTGNSAGSGGGMDNRGGASNPTVMGCTFSDNVADWGGGMGNGGYIFEDGCSSPNVTNCTFSGNTAVQGGGMATGDCSSSIVTNCTFSGNIGEGGGIYDLSYFSVVTSCVFWGDTDGVGVSEINGVGGSSPDVTYSTIQGGYEGDGNIDADPLFVDSEGGDLRLQAGSPCIDTGSNDAVPDDVTTDLDGNPRTVDGNADSTATVDMGAYEYQP